VIHLARMSLLAAIVAGIFCHRAEAADTDSLAFFENNIRPLLIENCVKCHGPKKSESGLRLDSKQAVLKGGESGPAVVAGKVEDSLLITAVRHEDGFEMPPGKKLSKREITSLVTWIEKGAAWPDGMTLAKGPKLRGGPITDVERAHWSYRKILDPTPPQFDSSPSVRNDIDRFVQSRLAEAGLKPRSLASKRVLIRRATFDLTGLPPAPAEIDAFLQDESENAFSKVVDRLLSSKAYGERWGRHWLDVVRYADTAGDTADYPTPLSYKYRNWVIDAFNKDKPYDQFVREQIAGDILAGQTDDISAVEYREMLTATGFIAISRRFGFDVENYHHLTIQDTIDTLGQAVLGLTLGCARCHDHKYDPVNTDYYYAWYGIFESTRYSFPGSEQKKRPYDSFPALPPPIATKRKADHDARVAKLDADIARLAAEIKSKTERLKAAGGWLAYLEGRRLKQTSRDENGNTGMLVWHGGELPLVGVNISDVELKVPGTVPPKTLVVHPNPKEGVGIAWRSPMAGRVLISGKVQDAHNCGDSVAWHIDHVDEQGLRNVKEGAIGTNSAQDFAMKEKPIEITVRAGDFLQLAVMPKSNHGCDLTQVDFTIAEVDGKKRKWNVVADVVDDFLEGNPNDDQYKNAGVWYFFQVAEDRGKSAGGTSSNGLAAEEIAELQATIGRLSKETEPLAAERDALKKSGPYEVLYAAIEQDKPKDAQIRIRGDRVNLGDAVPRKNLEILGGNLLASPGASGRAEMAVWLTWQNNTLTPRVMVNRIWQQHFGRGLVATANDFGTRGEKPSHPKLLDWLASRFVENGWSVKSMHRLLMNSATYQQSSEFDEAAAEKDPEARLLWRFNRRRLSAEEIRDAMLLVSGELDPTTGGEHPFPAVESWGFSQHAPYYGVYATRRRSVYLMQQRLQRHPFLSLFDGADVNVSTARRDLTTVPTQALYLMNSDFVHEQAASVVRRIFAGDNGQVARLQSLFELTLGRPARESELTESAAFLNSYVAALAETGMAKEQREQAAWSGFVRTILTRNEFLFVD
jgi:uncharacterized small protein (DUF1192 family)